MSDKLTFFGKEALRDAAAASVQQALALRSLDITARAEELPRRRDQPVASMLLQPYVSHWSQGLPRLLDSAQPALAALEELTLSGDVFSGSPDPKGPRSSALASAFAATTRFPALLSLTLSGNCGLSAEDLIALLRAPALARLSELTLSLEHDSGLDPTFERKTFGDSLGEALAAAPLARSLRRLRLVRIGMTRKGVRSLAAGGPWESLGELDLKKNRLGKDGLAVLAASPRFPVLERLRLADTGIDETGLKALATGTLATLVLLDVSRHAKLGDDALAWLTKGDRLPKLQTVCVGQTAITSAGVRLLRARFSRVEGVEGLAREEARDRELAAKRAARLASPPAAAPAVAVRFKDPNLTLIVIVALRDKGLLPRFDKAEFYAVELGRKYESKAEYNYRVDKEVLKHLLATPITPEMAAAVEELNWEPGAENGAFLDVWTYWDGEDDTFDIRSLAGIERLTGLRKIGIRLAQAGKKDPANVKTIAALRERGVVVDDEV